MTLKTLMASHVSTIILRTDDFAETVTRLKGGHCARAQEQTAVVFYIDTDVERGRGKGTLYASSMELAESSECEEGDAYEINRLRYEVVTITPAVYGLKTAALRRMDAERTEARMSRNLK